MGAKVMSPIQHLCKIAFRDSFESFITTRLYIGSVRVTVHVVPILNARCLVTPYRDQLKHNFTLKKYFIDISLEHLTSFDELLANELAAHPNDMLPLVRLDGRVATRIADFARQV
jgi:hypothetical protein